MVFNIFIIILYEGEGVGWGRSTSFIVERARAEGIWNFWLDGGVRSSRKAGGGGGGAWFRGAASPKDFFLCHLPPCSCFLDRGGLVGWIG